MRVIIKQDIRKAAPVDHLDLRTYKSKTPITRILFVFEFHPLIPRLARTLKQAFVSLNEDPTLPDIFAEPTILAMRQPTRPTISGDS